MLRPGALLIAAAALLGAGSVAAQGTGGTQPDPTGEAQFADIRLNAGFAIDPYLVTLVAGGASSASSLNEACNGYIGSVPSATLTLTGQDDFLRLFFLSESDTVLVVQTPDGEVLCNDDSGEDTLNPGIDIEAPAEGQYAIFAGTYDDGQLAPGFLGITSIPDLTASTFSFDALIARADSAPEATVSGQTASPELPPLDLTQFDFAGGNPAQITLGDGFPDSETPVVGGGDINLLSIDARGNVCNGFAPGTPSAIVTVTDQLPFVRVFFNGSTDATLAVFRLSDNAYVCNDDSASGLNLNPSIDFTAAEPGAYAIFVATFDPLQDLEGTLVITSDETATPEPLGPNAAAVSGQ